MAFSLQPIKDVWRVIPRGFGLSISDSSLKFVYLEPHTKKTYKVRYFGELRFKEGIVRGGRILEPEALTREIKEVFAKKGGVSLPSHAFVALPEEEVFMRIVQVPPMTKEELADAIMWETEANIPL